MTREKEGSRSRPRSRIPNFASREEEAEFWDTHSFADYWGELKSVKAHFAKNLSEGMTIRFDPETLQELRTQAKRKGIDPAALVRMWVLERLRGERAQSSP